MFVTHLGHVRDGIGVVHQFALIHLDFTQRVDGEQKLALVRADPARHDALHQFRVLVDEPRLAQHVRRRILQLHEVINQKWIVIRQQPCRIFHFFYHKVFS